MQSVRFFSLLEPEWQVDKCIFLIRIFLRVSPTVRRTLLLSGSRRAETEAEQVTLELLTAFTWRPLVAVKEPPLASLMLRL